MDAHVFRRLCDALAPVLLGARLEKIQSPAEHVYVLTIYGSRQRKQHLVFKAGRRDPFLYLASERPVAGTAPSALVMRWRKHCVGRRIAACVADWTGRRLLLLFSSAAALIGTVSPSPEQETWLVLDMREGPQLLLGKSPDLPEEPQWPEPLVLEDACHNWRHWPVLTPALRRTLPLYDALDQQALLMDLEAGGGDIFVYGEGAGAELCAWPLPQELSKGREFTVFEDPLSAASQVGDALVLGNAAQKSRALAAQPHVREAARLQRLLDKLKGEEKRLQGMVEKQQWGLALQNVLWKFGTHVKVAQVTTEDPDYPVLTLDQRHSIRENMQNFFHQASRGRRGLTFMIKRREELQKQWEATQQAAAAVEAGANVNVSTVPKKQASAMELPRGVQAFRSSDGFIILRGKDARGNWAALRAAAPQDLWMHVEGGPGSHAIIRRHFAGQEIPETTLQEAASLAAVKSWQKDNPTAHMLCAQVRHVKPMRGAAPGTVRIDNVVQTFRVDIDAGVEAKLAL